MSEAELAYFRNYILDLSSVRQSDRYSITLTDITDDDSLSYFRQYLGRV